MTEPAPYPSVTELGLSGLLVGFGATLSDAANRAALAFRSAADRAGWPDLIESAPSLASVHLEFDALHPEAARRDARVAALLASRDWYNAALPAGRRLWTIPAAFGGTDGPQLAETAQLGGSSAEALTGTLCQARLRVLTLGFAPGQPYLGTLPEVWDIPRQTGLTPMVPEGAIVLAVRQLVLFANASPTGWRHVGQTAFRCFRPETDRPFALRPGDEIAFKAVSADDLAAIRSGDSTGDGGARVEELD